MPRMTHPDLPGVEIVVDEPKARNRRANGWVDADGHPCDVCGKSAKSAGGLSSHMRTHTT